MIFSKKIFFSIILTIVLIGGSFYLTSVDTNDETGSSPKATGGDFSKLIINEGSGDIDSDGDGLKDWEESLRGTDENNPDTDGDGTTDGEEVALNRDPRKAGPDDEITETGVLDTTTVTTKTSEFGQEFLTSYLSLKNFDRLDSNAANTIFLNLSDNISKISNLPKYSEDELNLVSSNEFNVEIYAKTFISILKNNSDVLSSNELSVIVDVVESRGENTKKLQLIIEAHEKILKSLSSIPVPSEASELHIAFLNNYATVIESMRNILDIEKDPLVAVVGISQYKESILRLENVSKDVLAYFDLKNIKI